MEGDAGGGGMGRTEEVSSGRQRRARRFRGDVGDLLRLVSCGGFRNRDRVDGDELPVPEEKRVGAALLTAA